MQTTVNDNMPPVVSVVVPVYNTAERLGNCLDSLLAQTLNNIEIILVNDGSTDHSPEICENYQRNYPGKIRYLTGPNGGVCVARNRGIDIARGKWITFCDSDDIADPQLYETLYNNAVNADADLSCCALLDSGPEEKKRIQNFPYLGDAIIRDRETIINSFYLPLLKNAKNCNGYTVTCLFRRDLLEEHHIRFSVGVKMCEDECFILEYLPAVRTIATSEKMLYTYLRFAVSACSKYYRGRNDFYREKNWYLQACEKRRIFLKWNMDKTYPHIASGLLFREIYHKIQLICCDPELCFWRRIKSLKDIANQSLYPDLPKTGMSGLFRILIKYFPAALPPLCYLKRRKDAFDRTYRRK